MLNESTQDFVPWGRRLAGWIVDMIVFGLALLVVLVFSAAVHGPVHLDGREFLLPIVALGFVWELFWIAGPARGKPGHHLTGYRIVGTDGGRVSIRRATIRWAVRSVNLVLKGFEAFASAISIAVTPRRQAIHDLAARTVAVTPETLERLVPASPISGRAASVEPVDQGLRGPFL